MKNETEGAVVVGDTIELNVIEFNGRPVLETEFIQYDSELRARDLRERGIDEFDFPRCETFDEEYTSGYHDFRSVRIFHLAASEAIRLKIGDKVRSIIRAVHLVKEKTKDGRRKLHITVSNAMHIYRWMRRKVSAPHCLVVMLWCGNRLVKEKKIPLTLKKGIQREHGRAHPVIAEVLPNGSILSVSPDYQRSIMTTGDYRLAEWQKGRTMQDIDKNFLRVPSHDRMASTRERKRRMRYVY